MGMLCAFQYSHFTPFALPDLPISLHGEHFWIDIAVDVATGGEHFGVA